MMSYCHTSPQILQGVTCVRTSVSAVRYRKLSCLNRGTALSFVKPVLICTKHVASQKNHLPPVLTIFRIFFTLSAY